MVIQRVVKHMMNIAAMVADYEAVFALLLRGMG